MLDGVMMVVAVAVGSRMVVAWLLTMSYDDSVRHSSDSSGIGSSSTSTAIDLRIRLCLGSGCENSAGMLLCAGQVEFSKFSFNAVNAASVGSDCNVEGPEICCCKPIFMTCSAVCKSLVELKRPVPCADRLLVSAAKGMKHNNVASVGGAEAVFHKLVELFNFVFLLA